MLALLSAIRAALGSARIAAALSVVVVGVLTATAPVILGWAGITPTPELLVQIEVAAQWIAAGLIAWIIGDSIRQTPDGVKVIVAFALLLAAPVAAAIADDVLIVSKAGYHLLTSDAAGAPVLRPIARVIVLDQAPAPPPSPPGPPLNPVAAESKRLTDAALARGGTKNTGARISAVYGLVASSVNDGSIPLASALQAVKIGTDAALFGQADAAAWAAWRTEVGDQLTKLQQEGSLATKAQYVGVLKDIETGLNASTGFPGVAKASLLPPGEGILDGIDIAKIIELIKLLLELFKLFKPA